MQAFVEIKINMRTPTLMRITSLVLALLVAPLACGTLLQMAAETVGGTLGPGAVPATAAVLPGLFLSAAHAAPLPLNR